MPTESLCRACRHEHHDPGECVKVVNGGTGYSGLIPMRCPCVYETPRARIKREREAVASRGGYD